MDILSRSFNLAYIDPPGTGGSEELDNPSPEAIVSAIAALLKGLNSPLILCGHSFGALYAIELCHTLDCVQGLVLLAPGCFPKMNEYAFVSMGCRYLRSRIEERVIRSPHAVQ